MESFGTYIKQERKRHNISIDEVIKETKISREILSALEDDRQDNLPPLPYIKGFIRSYSLFLGLDPLETIYQYLQFYPQEQNNSIQYENEQTTVDFYVNKPLTKLIKKNKSKAITLIASVIIIVILIVSIIWIQGKQINKEIKFYNYSNEELDNSAISNNDNNLKDSTMLDNEDAILDNESAMFDNKGVTSNESAISNENSMSNKSASKDSTTNLGAVESASIGSRRTVLNNNDNNGVVGNNNIANLQDDNFFQKADASIIEDIMFDNERFNTREDIEDINVEKKVVEIRAEDLTWIDIKIDFNDPYDVIMQPGERLELKANRGFELTIGNAAGVEIFFQGNSLGSLGESKEVVHLQLPLKNQD